VAGSGECAELDQEAGLGTGREGRAASVSAYIADAMAQSARTRSITGLVADMRAEDGQPSEEDYAWARRALGVE
jgi:hypothetical protein